MYSMLKELNITPTKHNLYFLKLWTSSEGTAGDLVNGRTGVLTHVNNPLAITDPYHNWTKWETGIWNSVGVVTIDTPVHGGIAAAQFLKADTQNSNGYLTIIQALKSNSLQQMWRAVHNSAWCPRGKCDQRYPTAVYSALAAGGQAPDVGPPTPDTGPIGPQGPRDAQNGAQGAQGAQAAPGQLPGSIGPQGPKSSPPDISCGAKDPVVSGKKILGQTILPAVTACNVKAWTGGLIVVLGMQFLALGVIVVGLGIGQETKAGQAVKRTAKKAGGVVVTRRASGSSLTKPASATSAARTMAA